MRSTERSTLLVGGVALWLRRTSVFDWR